MKTRNINFISETDGLEISALEMLPEGEPKAIVQIVHGMCEYKERYLGFAEFLTERGYAVITHDHRGHGESIKEEGDLGYMYEGSEKGLLMDIRQLQLMAKKNIGGNLPYYLIGHSMGSLLVRCFVKRFDSLVDKLVVIGSPSKLSGMGAGLALANVFRLFKGDKGHVKLFDYLVMDMTYEARFKSENLPHAWVCSDRNVVEAYNADPKCAYKFTINGYKALIKTTMDTYSLKGWKVSKPELPIRFFSGEDDPCAVSREAFEKSVDFMKRVGYKDVEGKMYKGMRHEILNEPNRKIVYEEIESFLRK